MTDSPKAVVFDASFPTNAQPYKIHTDGGGVVLLEFGEQSYDLITALYGAAKGKRLRVMVEIGD